MSDFLHHFALASPLFLLVLLGYLLARSGRWPEAVGAALLGYRVGDVIEWPVPSGTKTLRIEEILYQPEAAGDMHL